MIESVSPAWARHMPENHYYITNVTKHTAYVRVVMVLPGSSYGITYPPFYLFYDSTPTSKYVICIGGDPDNLMWEDTYVYMLHGNGD